MSPQPPPVKCILFDVGGVLVVSPMQAILDYELANSIPPGFVNFAISRSGPTGAWSLIETGQIPLDDAFFATFKTDLTNPALWAEYWIRHTTKEKSAAPSRSNVPPVPDIDAKRLFWTMMKMSRAPDRDMYPALLKLRASGRFTLAALSNTVAYPPGVVDADGVPFSAELAHPAGSPEEKVREMKQNFEVFVSSAHVGMRKPDPRIYEYAVGEMNRVRRGEGKGEVRMEEVVFIDDIGQNLKGARELGMQTVKVTLGKNREAVKELEKLTGLSLLDDGRSKL
ncbi:HAD-like protein [Eremomyces bilateralis CBS 781.70]|uniref:HAD-like protein n=1 Tax=Eremomyces bilateralis CBS 781.70 TaxID=1392243 RepID=A0A6G1GB58_9PEZI|nr:HAD-like protein [Eremomyces bilateralis CBS 781.70]KAF1815254.1 HAD-like protein [Eremomyces bilateralis CBS 781.70]